MRQGIDGGRRASRRAEMLALVKDFESSHQSQGAFCRRHKLRPGTFQYWRRQARAARRHEFAEVEIVDAGVPPAEIFELVLRGGVIARLPFAADEDFIRRVVRAGGDSC